MELIVSNSMFARSSLKYLYETKQKLDFSLIKIKFFSSLSTISLEAQPANYMIKVNNRNTRTSCEI